MYRIVICQGYDTKGNKLVKNLTYSVNQSATPKQQEREAKKYAMDMEDKLKYGYDFNAEKMSFEDFANKWLESVKEALVKSAFMDEELNKHMKLTSANSINVARFLPQAFYYFNAYARMKEKGLADKLVICVPSGNFGNITAGLFGHEMGLPIHRFIAANNANDIFYEYLQTGKYNPQPSKQTIANAMDVGDPSNFARIYDLYKGDHDAIAAYIGGATYKDEQIAETMKQCYNETKYVLDPHGACGYRALKEQLKPDEVGVFLETAHPAKFKEKVDSILDSDIEIPARLAEFMKGEKKSIQMTKDFASFKNYLMNE